MFLITHGCVASQMFYDNYGSCRLLDVTVALLKLIIFLLAPRILHILFSYISHADVLCVVVHAFDYIRIMFSAINNHDSQQLHILVENFNWFSCETARS